MTVVMQFLSDNAEPLLVAAIVLVATLLFLPAWILITSAKNAINRRRTPRIRAPKPMPPLGQRVDPDRMAAVMQRVGEGIRSAAQARTEPTPDDIRRLHDGIERLCRDAGADTTDH